MYVRKIAAAATLACGAALAFAPLAAADLGDTVTSTLDSEIASENSLFEFYAALAGNTADIHKGGAGVFDTFTSATAYNHDIPDATTYGQVTTLETELYGSNPIVAGISGDTGPFSEFNGALTQFYNAYDVGLYASQNNGALDTNASDYIDNHALEHALTLGTPQAAENYLLNFANGDLKGFDGIFTPAATTVAPTDIDPTISSEISSLNSLFELDGRLAGVFGDIAPTDSNVFGVGFDTIDPTKLNDTFTSLVFGAAGASGDPGSYDVMNGALGEFFNASNVELYSLLNAGAILPIGDVIGTNADFLTHGVSTAFTEFLQAGFADLAGLFVPSM